MPPQKAKFMKKIIQDTLKYHDSTIYIYILEVDGSEIYVLQIIHHGASSN